MILAHPLGPGNWRITQHFGEHPEWYAQYGLAGHEGVDFGVPEGTPVYASHNGMAIPAIGTTYGKQVWVYGDGLTTVYAHLSRFAIEESGRAVHAGELIGYSGHTGNCRSSVGGNGDHLHEGLKKSGEFVEGFRGWIDPEPYLPKRGNMTQLWMQCQGHNYEPWVLDHAQRLGGVKLINPQNGDWRQFTEHGIPVLGRIVWPDDSDKRHVYSGAAGAEAWFADFWPTARQMGAITLWEGPNEPVAFTVAQAQALDAFTARLADLFHDNGLRLVGVNFSTGHPAFSIWELLGNALAKIDFLGRHSYACEEPWFGQDQWWHPYRLVKDVAVIRDAGLRVPPIILGETGIDRAGNPDTDGWRARGVSREEYTTLLAQYALRLGSLVPELEIVAPFTWLSTGWPSFDIDRDTSAMLVAKWGPSQAAPDAEPTPSTSLEERIRDAAWQLRGVPYNPDAAFAKYARKHSLGAPLSVEAYGQVDGYALQAFVDGIVYARVGDWENVMHIPW